MNKKFTTKEVCIIVFAIVVAIAFMETPASAIWTSEFWKEFLVKVILYGVIVEFIVILLNSFKK